MTVKVFLTITYKATGLRSGYYVEESGNPSLELAQTMRGQILNNMKLI